MYIGTGGAGFIGSNIVEGLNKSGITDILVVDNLKNSAKFHNLTDLQLADYMGKEDFLQYEKIRVLLKALTRFFTRGHVPTRWSMTVTT